MKHFLGLSHGLAMISEPVDLADRDCWRHWQCLSCGTDVMASFETLAKTTPVPCRNCGTQAEFGLAIREMAWRCGFDLAYVDLVERGFQLHLHCQKRHHVVWDMRSFLLVSTRTIDLCPGCG